eukprot:4627868-Pyramimonas_sp.AAC.1
MADGGHKPEELLKTGYPELLEADVMLPSCKITCGQGSGTLIGFALIAKCVSELVSLDPELQALLETRCGLRMTVKTAEKDV